MWFAVRPTGLAVGLAHTRYRARTPGFAPRPLVPGLTWDQLGSPFPAPGWEPELGQRGAILCRSGCSCLPVHGFAQDAWSAAAGPSGAGDLAATLLDRPAPAGILRAMKT